MNPSPDRGPADPDPYWRSPAPAHGAAHPDAFAEPGAAYGSGEGEGDDGYVPLGPRPYALTRGRTRPSVHLAVEALVQSVPDHGPGGWEPVGLTHDHDRIRRLCRQVHSVAEVAALLGMPLGVARVLVADLAQAALVTVELPRADAQGRPDVMLMERVLDGLRSLRY
ncbi:DUF742 domain-containing protein [Streptomyces vinaceus]|uniref:DUF742 domain-containing protein n=1 Tax=Streptomyces vinaceus TaxID=1960 RepID=UPI0038010C3A